MYSMTGKVYKKTAALFAALYRLATNNEIFTIITLLLLSLLLNVGLFSSLQAATLLLLFFAGLLSFKYERFFPGFFIVALFSLQFFSPNKYWELQILRNYDVNNHLTFPEGRSIGYGINLSNIFIAFSLITMVVESFKSPTFMRPLLSLVKHRKVELAIFFLFLLSGVYSAFTFSPFPALSVLWTFQYGQMFIVSFLVYYFFKAHTKLFPLMPVLFAVSVFFQFALSLLQFSAQSALGLPVEQIVGKQFYYSIDEIKSIFRVAGTFFYSNQLALVVNIITCLLIPTALLRSRKLFIVAILLGTSITLLTQSRINWLSLVVIFSSAWIFYHRALLHLSRQVKRMVILFFLSVIMAFSFIVVPRLMYSVNFTREGGGLSLRTKMFTEGLYAFTQNYLFGYGAGTNEVVLYSFFPNGIITEFPLPLLEAHLELLLEFGIVGTVLFLAPFYILFHKYVFQVTHKHMKFNSYLYSFLVGSVIITLHYLVQNHYGIIEFGFVGVLLGYGYIGLNYGYEQT